MSEEIRTFRLAIPDYQLADLRARLRNARWPEQELVSDWSQGVPLAYVKELCQYWAEEYDWRKTEQRLNKLPQYMTNIDGIEIHYIHLRSPNPHALPLIITHGWPGSVVEFLKTFEPLTDPVRHGGQLDDAFHVVCPSLPGYGFSGKPTDTGWGVERIAAAWAKLMARLGYYRYGAQGSDWGTSISTSLGQQDRKHVMGIHLMPPLAGPDPTTFGTLTNKEKIAMEDLARSADWESGYSEEQSTRPQTIGYALVDSPVALCAWIVEKLYAWTDCKGTLENILTRDEILDNLMFYWLPATGASSARLYWESIRQVNKWISESGTDKVDVPTGCSVFPKELQRPSRRWAEKRFIDIRYWNEPSKGGHFAALEQPQLYVDELRAFFRTLR